MTTHNWSGSKAVFNRLVPMCALATGRTVGATDVCIENCRSRSLYTEHCSPMNASNPLKDK